MNVDRAARLTALLQHAAWAELKDAIDEEADGYINGVMRLLLSTGKLPDDFEYKRGYIAGMRAVVRQPDRAFRTIQQDVKRHREEQLV